MTNLLSGKTGESSGKRSSLQYLNLLKVIIIKLITIIIKVIPDGLGIMLIMRMCMSCGLNACLYFAQVTSRLR